MIGFRRERRVVGTFLRRLEVLGCIKQVKARDHTLGDESKYFRCVKYIQEPGERESQLLCGQAHANIRTAPFPEAEHTESEDDDADEEDRPDRLKANGHAVQVKDLREVARPIPQWTGTGCIDNILHDVIHQSGTQGLSTMVCCRL